MQFQFENTKNGFSPAKDRTTLLEIVKNRSVPGILILDDRKSPVYFNSIAHDILHRLNGCRPPADSSNIPVDKIPKEIFDLYDELKKNSNRTVHNGNSKAPSRAAIIFWHRHSYCCRGFFLDDPTAFTPQSPHVMMLIEKVSQHRQINFKRFKERFGLTRRQMELLKLLGNGYSNREIAGALYVSENTVKAHLKHIMRRLDVHTRTEILSMVFQSPDANGAGTERRPRAHRKTPDEKFSRAPSVLAEGIPS
jgi:DNA-binding CsgD family transcriptional regulator